MSPTTTPPAPALVPIDYPAEWPPGSGTYGPNTRQALAHELALHADELLYGGARGGGKLLAVDTELPTPEGWTTMGEVRAGDAVFAADGIPALVTYVSPVQVHECFDVVFDDGSVIRADGEHRWHTMTHLERRAAVKLTPEYRARRRLRRPRRGTGKRPDLAAANTARTHAYLQAPAGTVRTTAEIAATLMTTGARPEVNHSIDVAEPLLLAPQQLPIPPYVLGAWLGDGTTLSGGFTCHPDDVEVIERIRAEGYAVGDHAEPKSWHIIGLVGQLRALGVLGNKHVPAVYLRASAWQRQELLQGLMDTDGTADADGRVEFTSTRRELADAVHELAAGLGMKPTLAEGRATLYGRDIGPKFRVTWTGNLACFHLPRKLARLAAAPRIQGLGASDRTRRRYIVECRPAAPTPMRCLAIDHPSHLYLAGRTMIPTHNTDYALAEGLRRCLYVPGLQAVFFRRTYPELSGPGGAIPRLLTRIPRNVGRWNAQDRRWRFFNGSTLSLSYLENLGDVQRWLGLEIQLMIFDQLEQIEEQVYVMVRTSLRASGPVAQALAAAGLRPASIATANPGGRSHTSVKRRFIDPFPLGGQLFRSAPTEDEPQPMIRCFVPARLDDNPALNLADPTYRARLQALPEEDRKAQLEGDWNVYKGARFSTFRTDVHVVAPEDFPPPPLGAARRACAIDYGADHPYVALWGVELPDGGVYVYREVHARGLSPAEQASAVLDAEDAHERGSYPMPTALDSACWAAPPDQPRAVPGAVGSSTAAAARSIRASGPPPGSIADTYVRNGVAVTQADKRRLEGTAAIAAALKVRPDGRPRLVISSQCTLLIETLPQMQRDPKRPEDYRKVEGDDAVDALRYLLMQFVGGGGREAPEPPGARRNSTPNPVAGMPTAAPGTLRRRGF